METDLHTRRALLVTQPAPHPRHDALVNLTGTMSEISVRLRYVPDRDILIPESFATYLQILPTEAAGLLEETAQTILEDINDQVIPCWLEVLASSGNGQIQHEVRIEDRQPKWQDRGLLDRLPP